MKYKDLQGQVFGKLTALYKLHNYHKKGTYWLCACDCGSLKEVRRQDLKRGYNENCHFVTSKVNSNNRRNTVYIIRPPSEWCEILNLNYNWFIEKALNYEKGAQYNC